MNNYRLVKNIIDSLRDGTSLPSEVLPLLRQMYLDKMV